MFWPEPAQRHVLRCGRAFVDWRRTGARLGCVRERGLLMIGARKNLARRGWAVAAAACLAITLAACQGDGSGDESPDPTSPVTNPAPAPNSPDPESSEGSDDPGGFKPPVISPYDPEDATPAECASIEWKDGATIAFRHLGCAFAQTPHQNSPG